MIAMGIKERQSRRWAYALVAGATFCSPNPIILQTPKKDNPSKDAYFTNRGEVGHWKRNCPIYSYIVVKKKKKLSQELALQFSGEGRKSEAETFKSVRGHGHQAPLNYCDFHLCIPNGLVLILHNCHYAPSITSGT
ncbi:hypothetical protein Tco_1218868 [Tanacetum coccineum]